MAEKIKKSINKPGKQNPANKRAPAAEGLAPYLNARTLPDLKDFSYHDFKRIADKVNFTQAEWSAILHLSERTLQRYAKSNNNFAPMNAERALQMAALLKKGKEVLGSEEKFYQWLKREPYSLEGNLSMESLTTAAGITQVFTQLGRIEHGLFT
ncbi:MAG: hypothetical protein ABS68_11635 [Niastella sp. SCN 39-18]|nr:DUF2384 domain-containing protein [Sphingobacteriales bacterium]ODT51801.1 MAG: hypothetical protein ABS68_11635 [Niastella sp. SCN 39-18]OJW10106.1 MAG: hypothetical protein BGO53_06115 [Sphingobacteriales bacterium 39-19]